MKEFKNFIINIVKVGIESVRNIPDDKAIFIGDGLINQIEKNNIRVYTKPVVDNTIDYFSNDVNNALNIARENYIKKLYEM